MEFNNKQDYNDIYFDQSDINENKLMAILSYIGPLFLIPYFTKKDSPFAYYHANQGLVLFIAEFVFGILSTIIKFTIGWIPVLGWVTAALLGLSGMIFLALSVIGIVNAANGKGTPLPFIGSIHIKF